MIPMKSLCQINLPVEEDIGIDQYPSILEREKKFFGQAGVDLEELCAQYEAFVKAGKFSQAGRIANLMGRVVSQKAQALEEHVEPRYLMITSKPELYENQAKYHAVIPYTADNDFVQKWLFVIYLYLKHPRIKGLVIENLQTMRDPTILQLLIEMTSSQSKQIYFARSSQLSLEQVEAKFRKLIDDYRFMNQPVPLNYNIIDSVGNCNLKCRMCPQADHDYKLQVMDFELFKKTIENVSADDIVRLSITNFSEPLMIPGFVDRLTFAAQARPKAYIKFNTNGTLLTEEVARQLVSCGLTEIWFSLNMSNREDYLWFTGKDLYERACRNIEMMRRVRDEMSSNRPIITVQQLSMPKNEGHYDAFKDRWSKVADQVMVRPLSNWGGVVDIDKEVMGNKPFGKYLADDFPCASIWQSLTINWNGDIFPCCIAACKAEVADSLRLGNVRTHNLLDVWRGRDLSDLRLRQFTNTERGCLGCDAYKEAGEGTGLILQEAIDREFYRP